MRSQKSVRRLMRQTNPSLLLSSRVCRLCVKHSLGWNRVDSPLKKAQQKSNAAQDNDCCQHRQQLKPDLVERHCDVGYDGLDITDHCVMSLPRCC
jgi:hypothetical protein